jgi:hypothetical protein
VTNLVTKIRVRAAWCPECGECFVPVRIGPGPGKRTKKFCSRVCQHRDERRRWRGNHPDKVADDKKLWRLWNADKAREHDRAYYARKKSKETA